MNTHLNSLNHFITEIVFTSDSKFMIKLAKKMRIFSIDRKKSFLCHSTAHSVWRDALVLAEKNLKENLIIQYILNQQVRSEKRNIF